MSLQEEQRAEFEARIQDMKDADIELYLANPNGAWGWFEWYRHAANTAEEKECLQIARSEISRRQRRYEDRRYWITTAIAILALVVSVYAVLK